MHNIWHLQIVGGSIQGISPIIAVNIVQQQGLAHIQKDQAQQQYTKSHHIQIQNKLAHGHQVTSSESI